MSIKDMCECGHSKAEHVHIQLNADLETERFLAECKQCDCLEFVSTRKQEPRRYTRSRGKKKRTHATVAGYIPIELKKKIDEYCKERGISVSNLITPMIEEGFKAVLNEKL